ncbi:epoxyqueuosine reductase QueH [Candidatus Woesearchaeota archaeon]|nr:epoxyqueuosine reductase QueH [Candidatus Woesearchaeota archaeon]
MQNKLLVHVCCAPCATVPLQRLREEYALTLFFYDPNIHPRSEYNKRLEAAHKLADFLGIPLIEGEYDADVWMKRAKPFADEPEGGKRCAACFDMRLFRTAHYAAEHGFPMFVTSLTLGPHKNVDLINSIGRAAASMYEVAYLESNFKKENGYQQSIMSSKDLGLYRQNYCGCVYSKKSIASPKE